MKVMKKELIFDVAAKAASIKSQLHMSLNLPIDPIHIAEQLRCNVVFKSLPTLEGMYSPEPSPVIILGSERPIGRRAFTCAHELGHHVYKHGLKADELAVKAFDAISDEKEYIADLFASLLLMPPPAIIKAIKDREIDINSIDHHDIFALSSYFGVGYATIISHLRWTLKLLSHNQYEQFKKISVKSIKEEFSVMPENNLIIVDANWSGKTIDLEIGDSAILPANVDFDNATSLMISNLPNNKIKIIPTKQGIFRTHSQNNNWATFIRVSRKKYEGISKYRFLPDEE